MKEALSTPSESERAEADRHFLGDTQIQSAREMLFSLVMGSFAALSHSPVCRFPFSPSRVFQSIGASELFSSSEWIHSVRQTV